MSNSTITSNETNFTEMLSKKGIKGFVKFGKMSIHSDVEGYWLMMDNTKNWMFIGSNEYEANSFIERL